MIIRTGNHLHLLLLVLLLVEHLLQYAVQSAVVKMRILLAFEDQVDLIGLGLGDNVVDMVLGVDGIVEDLLVNANHREIQVFNLPHYFPEVLLVDYEEFALHG